MPDLGSLHIPQASDIIAPPKKKKKRKQDAQINSGAAANVKPQLGIADFDRGAGIPTAFARFDASAALSDYTVFPDKLLFREGDYPDKGFSITGAELEARAKDTASVPLDHGHSSPTVRGPLDGKFGYARNLRTKKDATGKTVLYGDVLVANWCAPVLTKGETNLSCTWTRSEKKLHSIGLVCDPHITDAVLMAAFNNAHAAQAGKGNLMNKELLAAALALFKAGRLNADQFAMMMGGGSAPAGQTLDTDSGDVNTGGDPNPDGQMPGGEPMKKKKKKKTVQMWPVPGANPQATSNSTKGFNAAAQAKIAELEATVAKFKKTDEESRLESLLAEVKAATAAFTKTKEDVQAVAFAGEIKELANSLKFKHGQIVAFTKFAAEDPQGFAKVLPILQDSLPNPAVVGFSGGAIPECLLNTSIDAEEVMAEFNSEHPDDDLATFAKKLYAESQKSGTPMDIREATIEAGRRHPALVASRQAKTPNIG